MREARIVMSVADETAGNIEAHIQLERELAETFGGFTATLATGGWVKTPGSIVIVREPVIVYDVASMPDAGESPARWVEANEKLVRTAMLTGRELQQEAVYVRNFDGHVEVIDVAEYFREVREQEAYDGTKSFIDNRELKHMRPDQDWRPPAKKLPEVGEIWATKGGLKVAVVSRNHSHAKRQLQAVLLRDDAGRVALNIGSSFYVDDDGRHVHGETTDHPFDLAKFTGATF